MMRDDNSQQQIEHEEEEEQQKSIMEAKSVWDTLAEINVNNHTKSKNGLSYLSWAWAWGIVKEKFPDITYRVINYDGKPWIFDHTLGYMVQTEVTIRGQMIPMHLFVMDGANKAQRCEDYTYQTKYKGEKTCLAANMFDINTCIMRCLTKNLAMFGLGHYIYAGEDLPQQEKIETISKYQADKVYNLLKESNSNTVNFCKRLKINSVPEMPLDILESSLKLITDKLEKLSLEAHNDAAGAAQ